MSLDADIALDDQEQEEELDGVTLRRRRERLGLTIADLARLITEVSGRKTHSVQGALGEIEKGRRETNAALTRDIEAAFDRHRPAPAPERREDRVAREVERQRAEEERLRTAILRRFRWSPGAGRAAADLVVEGADLEGTRTRLRRMAGDGLVHQRGGLWFVGAGPEAPQTAAPPPTPLPELVLEVAAGRPTWLRGEIVSAVERRCAASRAAVVLEVERLCESGRLSSGRSGLEVGLPRQEEVEDVTVPAVPDSDTLCEERDRAEARGAGGRPPPADTAQSVTSGAHPDHADQEGCEVLHAAPAGETPEPETATGERAGLRGRVAAALAAAPPEGLTATEIATTCGASWTACRRWVLEDGGRIEQVVPGNHRRGIRVHPRAHQPSPAAPAEEPREGVERPLDGETAQPDAPAPGLQPDSPTGRAHDGVPHCPPPPVERATAQPSGEAAAEDAAHTAPEAGGSGGIGADAEPAVGPSTPDGEQGERFAPGGAPGPVSPAAPAGETPEPETVTGERAPRAEASTPTSLGRERAAPEPASVGVHSEPHVVDGRILTWCDEPECELRADHEEEHQDDGRRWLTGERGRDDDGHSLWLLRSLLEAEREATARLRARVSELAEEHALVDQARRAAEEDVADFRESLAVAEEQLRDVSRVLDLVDEDGSGLNLPARVALLVGELRARRGGR